MKKISLFIFAAVLLVACQQKATERYITKSAEIDAVKAHIKDYNEGNWEAWTTIYADTAKVYHNTTTAASPVEVLEGLQANLVAASSYNLGGDDQFMEMVLDDKGETWVNTWATWEGTLAGNGKKLSIPVHATYQFVGGKVVKEYAYYNLSEFMTMMQEMEAMNSMADDEKVIATTQKSVVNAWNKNDTAAFDAISTKNFVRNTNGVKTVNNQKEYTDMMGMFHTAFPDFKVSLDRSSIQDGKSYSYWTVTGTNKGEFMGNPPTGKKIKTHGLSVWSFDKDNKVSREDAFYDNMELYNQLGYVVSPPK